MYRSLTLWFQRDLSRDREHGHVRFSGYQMFWPDGRAVAIGLDAFCSHGQRLLGLDRLLAQSSARLIEILCFPVPVEDQPMTRLRGHRVRRFFLQRQGACGRVHFLGGIATDVSFVLGRDEPHVLEWIGLTGLPDGARAWFDLAARPADAGTDGQVK
jgi:hypothetical protein